MGLLSKYVEKNVFCGQQKFYFKTVILSMWSSFIVEALVRPQQTFLFNVLLITNLCPTLLPAERDVLSIFYFKILKFHL